MSLGMVFIFLGIAAWLGLMVMVGLVSIWPNSLRLVKALVCPPDAEMVIEKFRASYHRPGEFGLGVYYLDQNLRRHDIRGRSMLVFWGIVSVFCVPFAYMLIDWFQHVVG